MIGGARNFFFDGSPVEMQKEQLLNLLDSRARDAFEHARSLARARGGILSPLHLLVALLTETPALHAQSASLLRAASEVLRKDYPLAASSHTVTKETQAVLVAAGEMARAEGLSSAAPEHLLRAALASPVVREALGDAEPGGAATSDLDTSPLADEAPSVSAAPLTQTAPTARRTLTGALNDYCADLAQETEESSLHPFVGREREMTAVLETLCRKLKNNPLLIGKPGVGKSALVAAVAARLCEGRVPVRLRGKRILEVSRLKLLADAKYAGEIEERLKQLLEEVKRAGDVILFFDEMHTLLNAGGATGTGDVANLLKSALSKGDITCIGATTLSEYYKYIARDEALARRFSNITLEEPSPEETRRILMESCAAFESYHDVRIDEEIITLIVDQAARFLYTRSFPDKAFDLLDKAAAKASFAGLERVSREAVTETLSEMTGLPLEIMDEDPAERLERLEAFLHAAVPGQARAARDVARVVRIAKLGLELKPERPDGVFLFVGPEGVGKHELATALAKFLYGSSQKITTFDLSQYTEAHSLSRLIGAEPGYAGHGERGLLAKAAEDNPHSVLYFRNIDLAHAVVQQFLAEAFEHGRFTDTTGAEVSLSNTTVVMSRSQSSEQHRAAPLGFRPNGESGEYRITGNLRAATGGLHLRERSFGLVESLAATVDEVIEFQVLDREATEQIIGERLEALRARLEAAQPVRLEMDARLAAYFSARLAAERKSLAQLERLLQETIIIPFTQLHLDRHSGRLSVAVRVSDNAVQVVRGDEGATT
ncbi:MAG TPA: ATP-dependent Clp protease ATP-binding subunit [Blastocatellia bacterium]|nr:ATP-dependent Clp protease ATP-binding subunit [Blastocatellia bacterium]